MKKSLLSIVLFSIIILSGCNSTNNEIIAKGKSQYWKVSIAYKLEGSMLNDNGNMVYLKDNPPKKVEFKYSYPNGFPTGSSGTVEHYEENIKEFKIGGGSGSLNKGDNYENLKEKIDEMSVLIQWETDGKVYNETVDLNAMK
ncbi:hypothetical protein [Pseudobacillus wudalianchiensis]|uniref:Lipoprotein n=1 Tax=Pseudobacillus wudalianchiensis TaxID=1743143 RepID=A0A1B9B930_9BACI|nr:hypothetical protein [Bacillus wudalianchiensis]OCA92606.1 hypothetical protein A8F95_02610 [Bacillus wudalianchiensis]